MKYNDYETEEIMTDRLVLMKGLLKDFLKVYEYDFSKLQSVDNVFKYEENNNRIIRKWFGKGSRYYYKTCRKAHVFDWIIFNNDDAIGNITTSDEDIKKNSISLNFNLHPKYWGYGYMPEALSSAIDYLFKIGYKKITVEYLDGNERAKKVIDKLGFKPFKINENKAESDNGNKIDSYVVILDKEEWLSRTQKIKILK